MRANTHTGLYELLHEVQDAVEVNFGSTRWVTAEVSGLKVNSYSGHCYLTLVQKKPDGSTIASARATVWADRHRFLSAFFKSMTGSDIADGMEVLIEVQVQFRPQYGLTLNVVNIEPSYTVGASEKLRQQTIQRLLDEGMFDMNSTIGLPLLPRRLAVISSETAAGWRDFYRQLHENQYGYTFVTDLYPAVMQGAECPQSIIGAMDAVLESGVGYDALLILRGGGSVLDLGCYDDYELAVSIAQYPLPVLTGVGHDHDYHVCDMVCHTNLKTPTALADFIIDCFRDREEVLDLYALRIFNSCKGRIARCREVINALETRLSAACTGRMRTERTRLAHLKELIDAHNPFALLGKGYAIAGGKQGRITSIGSLTPGERITLMFGDGSAEVEIISTSEGPAGTPDD